MKFSYFAKKTPISAKTSHPKSRNYSSQATASSVPASKKAPKAIVIGAGFSGILAANSLHKKGFKVSIYEQAPALGQIQQGFSSTIAITNFANPNLLSRSDHCFSSLSPANFIRSRPTFASADGYRKFFRQPRKTIGYCCSSAFEKKKKRQLQKIRKS